MSFDNAEDRSLSQTRNVPDRAVMSYESNTSSAPISLISAFTGTIAAFVLLCVALILALFAGVFIWDNRSSRWMAIGLGLLIVVLYMAWIAWVARWYRRHGNAGFAMGLWIGTGMWVLITGACVVICLR